MSVTPGKFPCRVVQNRVSRQENGKLKRLVADLSLDKAMLQDVLSKKL